MNFWLSDEQIILRNTIRDFAEKEIKPVISELDKNEEIPYDIISKMADLGLFGICVPKEYGGSGMNYLSLIIVIEELSRIDASCGALVAASNALGIGPIYYYGTEKQRNEWLPRLCKGEILASFGLTEPSAGSDAGASKTTARLENGQWIINGHKIFITNATNKLAGICTVQAKTADDEMSCILVPNNTPGFVTERLLNKMVWRSSDTGGLYFDDCRVPEENLLGKRGNGFKQMLQTLYHGRLGNAAIGLGGAQGAYELALKYAKDRKQFGKPISSFQVNSFKLADMATEIEAGRNLLYKACFLKDQGKDFCKEASMSKLYCSEMMGRVVSNAIQIFGAYGLMKEYDIERFYRDQRILTIAVGTSEIQREIISKKIGC